MISDSTTQAEGAVCFTIKLIPFIKQVRIRTVSGKTVSFPLFNKTTVDFL
jgi:hypothetical protein